MGRSKHSLNPTLDRFISRHCSSILRSGQMLVLDPRNTRSYSEAKSFQRQARTKTSAARAQETAESAALLDARDRRSTSCVKDRDACGYADSIAEAPTAPSGYGSVAISGECPITDQVATSSQVNSSQKRLNYSSTLEHKCLRGTCVVLKQCICSPNGLQT